MSELVKICVKGQLPRPGEAKEFSAGARALCIANVDGVIRALDNECPHRGGPLSEGMIEDGNLICPGTPGPSIRPPGSRRTLRKELQFTP